MLVLDMSTVAGLTLTVMDEAANLEHDVGERGVTLWVAALPPKALATAKLTPRWNELVRDGRVYPSVLATIHAYRST